VASSDGLPVQHDAGSCRVFVMPAADCFSLGMPVSFSQDDMPVLRQRMGLCLYVDSHTDADPGSQLPAADVDSSGE